MTAKERYLEWRQSRKALSPVIASLAMIAADEETVRLRKKGVEWTQSQIDDIRELKRDTYLEVYIAIMLSSPQLEARFDREWAEISDRPNEWWWARREWSIALWRAQMGVPRG